VSQCNCSVCTKKGILHLPTASQQFELLKDKNALTVYTFDTGVSQHTFCSHCGLHAFYVPRSQPDRITVNARCLDGIDGSSLKPTRFFDGRHWEEAQRRRIAEGGDVAAAGLNGAVTLQTILDGRSSNALEETTGLPSDFRGRDSAPTIRKWTRHCLWLRAIRIALQIRSGLAGSWMCSMPNSDSASTWHLRRPPAPA
jgi:hypothetical protein